jgi:hypothetical protein
MDKIMIDVRKHGKLHFSLNYYPPSGGRVEDERWVSCFTWFEAAIKDDKPEDIFCFRDGEESTAEKSIEKALKALADRPPDYTKMVTVTLRRRHSV